jgi:toxin YoeB
MRDIVFHEAAFKEFIEWSETDKNKQIKIGKLILASSKNPFKGIGKPEPLKHELKGYWSRRIDSVNRLVYQITDKQIIIISCKYHY